MACVVGGVTVVAFDVGNGSRLAAVWDGGDRCNVHVVVDGRYGPTVEVWDMTGTWMPCTPDALAELVAYRLSDDRTAAELGRMARASVDDETAPIRGTGVPRFSVN
jgi:hypothetical protein